MRFELTDEQRMLRDMSRDFAKQAFDDATLGAAAADPGGAARTSAWASLHELGLVGLLVPEEHGGSGGSVTDACVVAEALGGTAAPVPYVGSAIAAPAVLRAVGSTDDLAAIASGATTCIVVGRDLSWPAPTVELAWDWLPDARGLLLDGGGARCVALPDAVPVTPTYDALHPVARVAPTEHEPPLPTDDLRRAIAMARVGLAAFSLGLAGTALDVAVDYAKEREQYGRPIGTFQAVQHMCADMLVDVESSRSIVYGASWAVEHAAIDEAERMAAAALTWTGAASIRVCETSIQVLGGIGVTIEHTAHRRLRTAHHFGSALGGARGAAATIADQKIASLKD
jgi:alkylation response protein AidB-like acyl-CoA dehydrogenase